MSAQKRWTIIAIALLLIGGVALWFRADDTGPRSGPTTPTRPTVDLTAARAEAALRRCPRPAPGATGRGPLAGVRTTCLGDGSTVDLGAALTGQAALIHVWATWCEPCRQELPVLDEYTKSAGTTPVISVQVQSEPADGLHVLASMSVRLPTVLDDNNTVSDALHLPSQLPASYVLTPDGKVHRVQPMTPFTSPEQIQAAVDRYVPRP